MCTHYFVYYRKRDELSRPVFCSFEAFFCLSVILCIFLSFSQYKTLGHINLIIIICRFLCVLLSFLWHCIHWKCMHVAIVYKMELVTHTVCVCVFFLVWYILKCHWKTFILKSYYCYDIMCVLFIFFAKWKDKLPKDSSWKYWLFYDCNLFYDRFQQRNKRKKKETNCVIKELGTYCWTALTFEWNRDVWWDFWRLRQFHPLRLRHSLWFNLSVCLII